MEPIRILSFDPGPTNTGYGSLLVTGTGAERKVLIDSYKGTLTSPKGLPDRERNDIIGNQVAIMLDTYRPHAVGIEDWNYMGSKGKQESTLPALIENLRMQCKMKGLPVYVFENAEWKKLTLRIGGANKEQIKHYVGYRTGDHAAIAKLSQHALDSIGICFAVLQKLDNK